MHTDRHPVWLLDVDGVINANRPGWGGPPRSRTAIVDGLSFRIRWAPDLIVRINALRNDIDIRWSTTWCEHADTLHRILDAGPFPVAFKAPFLASSEWKLPAALDVVRSGRPLIWTDDSAIPSPGDSDRLELEAAGSLLIEPRPNRGLQPSDLDAIADYARARAAA